MTIDIYGGVISPFCRSVLVVAKKIGVDLNLVNPNVHEGGLRSEVFLQINPFHTIPTIVDDGFKLFESRAIMTYLMNKYAPDSDLYPKDLQKRALVDAMLNFDAGSLTATLVSRARTIYLNEKDLGEAARREIWEASHKMGQDQLESLDLLLSRQKYAAGDSLTIADIAIVHSLAIAEVSRVDFSHLKHVVAYYKKIKEELGEVYSEINDEPNRLTAEQFSKFHAEKFAFIK